MKSLRCLLLLVSAAVLLQAEELSSPSVSVETKQITRADRMSNDDQSSESDKTIIYVIVVILIVVVTIAVCAVRCLCAYYQAKRCSPDEDVSMADVMFFLCCTRGFYYY